MRDGLPLCTTFGIVAERLAFGLAVLRLPSSPLSIRPGGTINGPAQMLLADAAMWGAVLAATGDDPRPLTTNLAIDFLRRPEPGDLVAVAEILALDTESRLATGIVRIARTEGAEPVSFVTSTYALP